MRVHCDCHVWRQPMTWRKKKMRIIFRVWSPHWDRLCATNDNDTTRMHTAKPITIRISICTNIKSIIYLLSPGNIVRYHLVWRAYFYWITSSNRCKWIENLFARNAFNSNWTFAWSIDSAFSLQIALFRFSMLKYSMLLFFFFHSNSLRCNHLTDLNRRNCNKFQRILLKCIFVFCFFSNVSTPRFRTNRQVARINEE